LTREQKFGDQNNILKKWDKKRILLAVIVVMMLHQARLVSVKFFVVNLEPTDFRSQSMKIEKKSSKNPELLKNRLD